MRRASLVVFAVVSITACKPATTPPVRLVLSTSSVPLAWGERQTVTAHAFIGTTPQRIDGLTWESSDSSIATVEAGADGTATLVGAGAGTATITAHLRDASAELTVTVAPRVIVLQRIEVTAQLTMLPRGLTLQLAATGHYDDDSTRDLTASVAWASADSSKATVSGSGLVTAVDVGEVDLRALKSGLTGTLRLTVTAPTLSAIDVRPSSTNLPRGASQTFTATGRFSDASSQPLSTMVSWTSSDQTVLTVDGMGRGTAVALGEADVTASFGGVTGTAHVTVTSAALRALEALPSSLTLPLGSSSPITLQGRYSDGTMVELTTQASWRSGTPAVATVDDGGIVTAVGQGLSVITATVGSISTTSSVTGIAAQLSAIQVTPQTPSVALGLTQAMAATGVYTDATTRDLTSVVTWTSSDAGVAAFSNVAGESGLLRTVSEGTITVSASNGTLTGTSVVTVAPELLLSMQLSPATVSVAAGGTQRLTAEGTFSNGSRRDVTAQATWQSNDAGVATVSNDPGTEGLVRGVAVGNATIDATLGLVTARRDVVVTAAMLQRIDVSAPASSVAAGRTLQLVATGVFSDGSTQNLTASVTWAPASGATFRVSSSGLLTALQPGTATASATFSGTVGALAVQITPAELESIAIVPATPTVALGLTRQLTARGTFSDGSQQDLSSGLSWTTGDGTVATVSATGLVSTVAEGQTSVTVNSGAISANTTLTVGPAVLVSIALTPASAFALDKLQTQQVTAQGTLSNAQTLDVTSTATWSSTTPTIASVSSSGLVTALTPGATTITATQAGVSASVPVTVNRPALQSLAITPQSPHVTLGQTRPFTATATYIDASTEDVTALVTWSSTDGTIATINASGVATGVRAGSTTIGASWNGQSDATTLTVDQPALVSIAISGSARFATGTATRLTATGTYADSSTADLSDQVTWVSGTPSVIAFTALSGAFGLAQGLTAGTSSITASLGAVTSTPFSLSVVDTNAPYAGRCGTGLVISQVYGGGGNTGATLRNDFVELHNPTPNAINLSGYSLQYTSSAGTSWGSNLVALSNVSVPAGGYYLVMMASGGANGTVFTGDQNATAINMSATAGKVLLANVTTGLTGACPTTNVIDLVGYGGGANCFEGTAAAPAPSTTASITRGVSACRDANGNNADFSTSAPNPRTLASTSILCACFVNGLGAPDELQSCQLGTATLTVNAGDVSPLVATSVTQPGVTDTAGFGASLRVQTGFGAVSSNPTTAAGWRWWPAPGATPGPVTDGYAGVFVAPLTGSYAFTARASIDGVNWTACDLNAAGSGAGLTFDTSQLGALSVP